MSNKAALKRIQKDLEDLSENPIPNCAAGVAVEDLFTWQVMVMGPDATPYEGGLFFIDMNFPSNYPLAPPKVKFMTKIYHCNVDSKGGVCLDILTDQWSPIMTASKVQRPVFILFLSTYSIRNIYSSSGFGGNCVFDRISQP